MSDISVQFKTNYTDTTSTRQYTISGLSAADVVANDVRERVQNINSSLSGGTADSLATFFISDDYDASEGIGKLKEISDVLIKTVDEFYITEE